MLAFFFMTLWDAPDWWVDMDTRAHHHLCFVYITEGFIKSTFLCCDLSTAHDYITCIHYVRDLHYHPTQLSEACIHS